MKRDMDLIRKILLKVEELDVLNYGQSCQIMIEGYDDPIVNYHIGLLAEAGLLEAKPVRALGFPNTFMITKLTWEGHDFIDTARNDTVWKKAKEHISEKFGKLEGVSFDVLKGVLLLVIKQNLGL